MNIVFPNNTTEIIDAIRGAVGRDVTFYYVYSSSPCPICTLDPVTNTSTNSFCLVCSGTYWIATLSGYVVSGHITWGQADMLQWNTGGQYYNGDVRVQVKYTPELVTILDETEYVLVDGKSMQINSRMYRGVPQINRILLDLIEQEK